MGYGGGGYGGGGYGRGGNGGGYGGGGGRKPFEKKDGEGRLFEENQKKGPNSPDFSGYIIVNGQEIKISGWGKSGQRGFSINLKVRQGNQMMPENGGQGYGVDFASHRAPQRGPGQVDPNGYNRQAQYGPGPQQPAFGHEGVPYQAPSNARPFPGPQQAPQGYQPPPQGWAPPPGQQQPTRPQATPAPAQGPAGGVGYGQPPGQDFSPPPAPDDEKLPF